MRGSVYLIGSNQGSALTTAVARATAGRGGGTPIVAVSSVAMSQDPDGLPFVTALAAKIFGESVHPFRVPGEGGETSDKDARRAIASADIVFLPGGDPVVGARALLASGADAWLREARERGASLIGVSAGSIMLSSWWASWPDEPPPGAPFDGGELVPCTRVVGDLVVDCHAEDENWCELKLVVGLLRAKDGKAPGRLRWLGLPHGGGVIVDPNGNVEPIGKAPFVLAEPDR